MTVRLVILGLLRERPLYGYEIKQIIEEHMSDWTSIAFGSIYFALDKLAEEGFVEKSAVEQDGKRPSRTVFQITDAGREEFIRLLREGWGSIERQYFAIDIHLFFIDSLPREEVMNYLRIRQAAMRQALEHIQNHRDEELARPEVPPLARMIFDHSLAHTRAELEWLNGLIEQIDQGIYP